MGGLACQAILDEFEEAKNDIKKNPHAALLWQTIIGKYHPTLLGACKKAIEWSETMVSQWLENNMCNGDKDKVANIISTFANHTIQKSHSRHISKSECQEIGLVICDLEENQALQDAVLTTHHSFMHTFSITNCVKLIENQNGVAYIEQVIGPR